LLASDAVQCLKEKLENNRKEIGYLLNMLMNMRVDPPWTSFEWQKAKYIIARSIASCLCPQGCHVYLLEMHGGEPSGGLGDKDIDLAVDCPPLSQEEVENLEKAFEKIVIDFLSEILGGNAKEKLKVPNVVELHSTSEFIIKKHIEARDTRYVINLC